MLVELKLSYTWITQILACNLTYSHSLVLLPHKPSISLLLSLSIFYKILFSSDPPYIISSPNNSNSPFFDASFMVLFPNALSISFIATLSNLHHLLLSSFSAFPLSPSYHPPLVMSCLGLVLPLLAPFYFYPCR